MIRIDKNKLVIEINCKGIEPLSALVQYQEAIIALLHIADLRSGQHSYNEITDGVFFGTNLLKEMMISEGQNAVINKLLIENKMDEFNKWSK